MFMSFCWNDSSATHSQCCVFTHVASIYANLLEQKKAEKSSTPTGPRQCAHWDCDALWM